MLLLALVHLIPNNFENRCCWLSITSTHSTSVDNSSRQKFSRQSRSANFLCGESCWTCGAWLLPQYAGSIWGKITHINDCCCCCCCCCCYSHCCYDYLRLPLRLLLLLASAAAAAAHAAAATTTAADGCYHYDHDYLYHYHYGCHCCCHYHYCY